MLGKFEVQIDTARTIDTPYLRKKYNTQNANDYENPKQEIKRKNFLLNENSMSLTLSKRNQLEISQPINQNNTINTSKNKSFARQEQHSKNFVKSIDRTIKQRNFQEQSHENNNKINDAKSLEIKRCLSRKTEKIKFAKVNAYLQEVKSRKILDSIDSGDLSMTDLAKKIDNKNDEPELNVEVCERYCAINTSASLINLNRYHHTINEASLKNVKEKTKISELFPKSKKYKDSQENKNLKTLNDEYYPNRLPINAKTLLMSKKYNFKLKDSSHLVEKNQNKMLEKKYVKETKPRYTLVQSFYRSSEKSKKYDKLSQSTSLRKTESLEANLNRSALICNKNHVKLEKLVPQNSNRYEEFILLENIPENILIQQENLRNEFFQKSNSALPDYGFENSFKSYEVKSTTKTFICQYCLEIFNIFEITGHKGKVCNISHKESEFVEKITKLSKFLLETYNIYYQRRSLYECFHDLAKQLELKLKTFTDEKAFELMTSKLRSKFYRKENYYRPQFLILKEKDKIFIDEIEKILHLDDFIKLEAVFEAVDKIILLGKNKEINDDKKNVPVYLPKIVLTKDLFWLVRKLFEGLILIKIKQIQI